MKQRNTNHNEKTTNYILTGPTVELVNNTLLTQPCMHWSSSLGCVILGKAKETNMYQSQVILLVQNEVFLYIQTQETTS